MKLHLDIFEGPLDLLLYLIKKNNLEISRVSIARITEQYLEYLDTMKELNVDMASEFLLMAAELAHIKSKAILPHNQEEDADEDDGLNADQLVSKLRAYQRYKILAQKLNARRWLNRDVFKRGSIDIGTVEEQTPESQKKDERLENPNIEVSTYDLVKAFNDMLRRIPPARRNHHVAAERVSVTERIYEILDELRRIEHVLFTDLFKGHVEKIEYIVTFLAILEMGKLRMVHIFQTETYGSIRVQRRVEETVEEETPVAVDASTVTYK